MVDEIQRHRHIPQKSNALDNYYGWNSSMGRDVRNEPSLPPQFQYRDKGRTVVSDIEPGVTDFGLNRSAPRPNFRAPSGIGGGIGSALGYGRKDPFDPDRLGIPEGYGRKDPFDPDRLGIPEGYGRKDPFDPDRLGIGSLQEQAAVDPSDWRSILRILEAGGDPGTETQTAGLWQTWQTIKDRIGEDAANDWLASQQPAYANRGGLMSLRR